MKAFIRWASVLLVLFLSAPQVAAQYRGTTKADSSSIRPNTIGPGHLHPNYVEKIRPLIAICYDDGYYSVWDSCYWHLHLPPAPATVYSQGDSASVSGLGLMPATIAIVGKQVSGDSTDGSSCKFGFEQTDYLRNAGWEIAAHSWTHGNKWLTGDYADLWAYGSRDSFEAEIGKMYRLLADTLGWDDVVTWVYPYGETSPEYAQAVGNWYRYGISVGNVHVTARNATQSLMVNHADSKNIDLGALGYGAIYSPLDVPRHTNKDTWADVWGDIHKAINGWATGLIFMAHHPCTTSYCGSGEPTSDLRLSSAYDYSWYDFIATLDTLRAEDQIEVVTVRELLDRMTGRPLSPSANWIDGRMKDADDNGKPNGAYETPGRHHVGKFPMEHLGEAQSDTIGVDGGDVWGIKNYSGGLGLSYWGTCASAVNAGDMLEIGAYFCIIDTTYGTEDSTLWDIDGAKLNPTVLVRGYDHSGADQDSTTFTLQSTDALMKSQQPALLDVNHIYVYRDDGTTQWLHLYRNIRARQQWDTFRVYFYLDHPAGAPDEALYDKVGISSPYIHVKKRQGVKW